MSGFIRGEGTIYTTSFSQDGFVFKRNDLHGNIKNFSFTFVDLHWSIPSRPNSVTSHMQSFVTPFPPPPPLHYYSFSSPPPPHFYPLQDVIYASSILLPSCKNTFDFIFLSPLPGAPSNVAVSCFLSRRYSVALLFCLQHGVSLNSTRTRRDWLIAWLIAKKENICCLIPYPAALFSLL